MPTITLRLNDETKDELDALARGRGVSLSDLIRSALDSLLARPVNTQRVDVAPPSLTAVERQQLALLHRILARVVGQDNDVDGDKAYQLDRAVVLENGFVREYGTEFAGIYPELNAQDSEFLVDVLDLFRIVTFSIDRLTKDGVEIDQTIVERLEFDGFDANDPREAHMLSYAEHLVGNKRWPELRHVFSEQNGFGNSHSMRSEVYARMLGEHEAIKSSKRSDRGGRDAYLLSPDELRRLVDAQMHPDRRQ